MTLTDTASLRDSGLAADELQDLMRRMVLARTSSNRVFSLQRQGRVGTVAPIDGNEAVVVGTAAALDPEHDWVLPQYREFHGLTRFGDELIRRFVLYLRGHPAGGYIPEPIRVWPPQIALATQIPQAVGLAWGMQLQGEQGVAVPFFGDGASSEGDFYEACNLAGVLRAPVVFLCVNNAWAISTPVAKQTAASSFAAKAAAFGFPGELVDGTDVLAVFEAVRGARKRALAGEGPTLIEAKTYRLGPHTTADDPKRYVPAEEIEEARRNDPIDVFRRRLEAEDLWDETKQEEAEQAAHALLDEAIEWAEQQTIEPTAMFDNVYAEPLPRMRRQRRELEEQLAEGRGDD